MKTISATPPGLDDSGQHTRVARPCPLAGFIDFARRPGEPRGKKGGEKNKKFVLISITFLTVILRCCTKYLAVGCVHKYIVARSGPGHIAS